MKKTDNRFNRHVVWFRQDLRLTDNRALSAACEDRDAVVYAIFTAPLAQWNEHGVSARQIAFMHEHLKKLSQGLAGLEIPLVCHVCDTYRDAAQFVIDFCDREQIDELFFNNQYELNEQRRDHWLQDNLSDGVKVNRYDDCLLLPPGAANTKQGGMYKVFTPFKRAFMGSLGSYDTHCLSKPEKRRNSAGKTDLPDAFYPCEKMAFGSDYPVGEEAAIGLLETFCREKVRDYDKTRDRPDMDGTSRVSAYLAIGVLSPRQCLNALSKNFGELKVLENIDFAIREGEIFSIIGTSGSGKSTFLNIISGLLEQDSGSFRISGKASGQFSGWKRIAYMFQEDRLLPWRTVRDNVAFGLENTALDKQAKKARVDEVIHLVGLNEFADYWPHQISGGMRSRVALARSLVIEPEVLLMDEPFSKLDAQTRSQMHGELLRLHELTGMTIVFVTHDVEEAAVLADRVAVFSSRPGRVKEIVDVNLDRPRLLTDARLSEQIRALRRKI